MKRTRTKKRARILIVDDDQAALEALALQIARHADLEVCGKASDICEALRLVADSQPDLVIIEISCKSCCGIELIKRIKSRNDSVRMLVWSMHSESLYAERALRAGALGYINKDAASDAIIEAVRLVLDGKVYLSDAMGNALMRRAVGRGTEVITPSPLDVLADRELEVFALIGQGVKNAEVADRLHLSITTIETYRHRIRQKLSLRDGMDLAHYAAHWMLENG